MMPVTTELRFVVFADTPVRIQWITRAGAIIREEVITEPITTVRQQERDRIRAHLGETYTAAEVDALIGPEDE